MFQNPMLRIGLQNRLRLNPLLQIRTQVSRAAKKVGTKVDNVQLKYPQKPPPTDAPDVEKQKKRALNILPRFMKNYASKIAKAPISHVTAFLIVHELTAIVPLFGIWGAFYYFDYLPLGIPDFIVENGAHFIRRMAERQGWTYVLNAEAGSRIILQGAAAWGFVKAIMPLRIAFSLWTMPTFAKWVVVPITSRCSSLFRKVISKK